MSVEIMLLKSEYNKIYGQILF